MSDSSPNDLTLASLPPDIIRMIIQLNKGECMESTRIVSRLWNQLIGEFSKRLPPVESVFMKLDSPYGTLKGLSLDFTIAPEHLKNFEHIFPKDWTIREDAAELRYLPRKLGTTSIRLIYRRPLKHPSTFIFLSRLFQSTNQIDYFSFDGFDDESLAIARKTMRNVNIQYLEIRKTTFNLDIRKNIREMIRLHQVYHLIVQNHTFYKDELYEIFEIIPKSTPNVSVVVYNYNGMQKQDFQGFCDSLIKFLLEKKGKALAKFVSHSFSCERAEPFLTFMRTFVNYGLF